MEWLKNRRSVLLTKRTKGQAKDVWKDGYWAGCIDTYDLVYARFTAHYKVNGLVDE